MVLPSSTAAKALLRRLHATRRIFSTFPGKERTSAPESTFQTRTFGSQPPEASSFPLEAQLTEQLDDSLPKTIGDARSFGSSNFTGPLPWDAVIRNPFGDQARSFTAPSTCNRGVSCRGA